MLHCRTHPSGTENISLLSCMAVLNCARSSAFRGFPCTLAVPWSLDPYPIVVLTLIMEGLSLTAIALSMARSIAARSESPVRDNGQ